VYLEDVAGVFAQLEQTRGRLRAIRLVAALLSRLEGTELEAVVYLLQGRLRPPYEGIEVGLGERMLTRAIGRAYTASESAVSRRYRVAGDLGLVAEQLAAAPHGRRLTVRRAYEALMGIAGTSGAGAVERKLRLVVALLGHAAPLEARYLVRIIQGRLRLGVGDATIVEATASAALRDRRKKSLVERAYNVRADLGGVVCLAFRGGAPALRRIAPRVGVPIRPALAQRLPSAEAIIRRLGTVLAEPKYDGFRLQVHRAGRQVRAFSRRLDDVSEMFPEIAAAVRRQLRARRAIIEGEAVGYDRRTGRFLPFQVTITRKRTHRVAEAARSHPLRLFAFDLLLVNGKSYLERSQRERHAKLAAVVRGTARDPIVVTEMLQTDRAEELQAYFNRMIRRGLEGVVAKRPDAPYRAGARGYDWVKLKRAYQSKLRDTMDVVLVGYLAGRGKRASLGIGSLLAAVYDPDHDRFRTVAKIGSGPSEAEWKALRVRLDRGAVSSRPRRVDSAITPDVWVEPRLVVEVLADEITRSPRHTCGKTSSRPGYALRFPRLLGVRSDKGPEDATTEAEILGMFRMQRARPSSR
jgi:DNA ligase 1